MKAGVIFSGQGAQFPGMGNRYYCDYESSREIFDLAGTEIKKKCFEGTEEELRDTKVTQPTVFTAQVAAWAALNESLFENKDLATKIQIAGLAGFSLGEYGAYTAAGVFADFRSGLNLVTNRGIFMAESGQNADGSERGSMAAVIGDRQNILDAVAETKLAISENDSTEVLEAVNFNSPKQTAVAGDVQAIARLKAISKEKGLKVIPLKVSTAFHSPIMIRASESLATYVKDLEFSEPKYKLYSNITGKDMMQDKPDNMSVSEYIRDRISTQVKSPVFWQETIENMNSDGIDVFVETGPGKTLSGLVKKILPDAKIFCISDPEGLEQLIAYVMESGE